MIRPADVVILLAGVLLVALLGIDAWSGERATVLRVTQGTHTHEDFPLSVTRTLSLDGPLGTTRIEIRDGRARVVASPCTQKICIRSGWLANAGDASACVPNRVSLVLLGSDARFDAMSF